MIDSVHEPTRNLESLMASTQYTKKKVRCGDDNIMYRQDGGTAKPSEGREEGTSERSR